ncbi:hypothetical protein KQ940_11185 [Marinobacterium sp. D7]|uniref:hypothetical protein n=1 Tax=Marinobacterium ramblicola TaxID=2849041 RepID=UPI001C2DA30E|nr:hypothetical protein [Marinobacterium ramblicola]MBV1788617.1 hypothetical protein [Marinobacterium ramblicola]
MTNTMSESGLKAYDLFEARLEMLRQHLKLCQSRVRDQSGMSENEQTVTFAHLLNQVEELAPLFTEAVDSAAEEEKQS